MEQLVHLHSYKRNKTQKKLYRLTPKEHARGRRITLLDAGKGRAKGSPPYTLYTRLSLLYIFSSSLAINLDSFMINHG